jgi:DNA repair protein RadC
MRSLAQEAFCVLTLNTKNRVIRRHLISLGTLSSTPVHPREVFRPAITDGAAAVIVAHNHPSGDPAPSADDLRITKKLIEAGKQIEIAVLDHLIVGDGQILSLKESGLVEFNP